MCAMPEFRTLFGVDVIASASNPGYHLERVWGALSEMLSEALDASGITPEEVVRCEPGGDGALYVLPGNRLGALVDLTDRLDKLAARRNRWHRPDLRLRMAIETGAVSDHPTYEVPMIRLCRLLAARGFKSLVNGCVRANTDDRGNCPVNSGLIMSTAAYRAVFGGDYTEVVRDTDFAEIPVSDKEFAERAWVRVPGIDARSLSERATTVQPPDDEPRPPSSKVTNTIHGDAKNAVQAHTITGGIRLGDGL